MGLQTDEPLKRAIKPLGGVGVVKSALEGKGRLPPAAWAGSCLRAQPSVAVTCSSRPLPANPESQPPPHLIPLLPPPIFSCPISLECPP